MSEVRQSISEAVGDFLPAEPEEVRFKCYHCERYNSTVTFLKIGERPERAGPGGSGTVLLESLV